MDEFSLIHDYFRPLAATFPGSLDLSDDAALLAPPAGYELAVTADAISAGVHFIGNEDAGLIARKLLRVNLSDLAAMGAKPLCYFLVAMLPKETTEEWMEKFASGLREDQRRFGISLAGGDTISTLGPLTFSLTALGLVPVGKALRRSIARAGDCVYVSGTLGDSALGLHLFSTPSLPPQGGEEFLKQRYLLPEPRVALGQKLIGIAHAAMDISDGLVQDLGHICKASGVGAIIHRSQLPLSKPAAHLIETEAKFWDLILGGGDDYELLFTAPPETRRKLQSLAEESGVPLTEIGEITEGPEIALLDESGGSIILKHRGFKHF